MNYQEYLLKREVLVKENSNLVGNVLNANEQIVNNHLQNLKNEIHHNTNNYILQKMNILGKPILRENALYSFLKDLPKGSDLHVHAGFMLPAHHLIDFVASKDYLVVDINDCHIYHINEIGYDKNKCFTLQECLNRKLLTRETILNKWTMLGKKHNESVWDCFERILLLFKSLEYSEDCYYDYYVNAFEYYLNNNVFHIEIHAVFSDDYQKTLTLANTIKRAYFHVKKKHPELIVSIICSGLKHLNIGKDVPEKYLKNAIKLRETIVDDYDMNNIHPFIIGFDLLNEEDKSIPLKELAPMLLKYRNKYPDFNLYIHCGESLNAKADGLIDAYLLGAKRVGHGLNLYRFPKLLSYFVANEICLEVCPISNKVLQYVKDLRLHPITEYLKRGVVVSLCSDDPVCQEYESLVDDFFAGTICWDLDLADIKQLCINSILYSGIDQKQKSELIKTWKKAWDSFISKQIKKK